MTPNADILRVYSHESVVVAFRGSLSVVRIFLAKAHFLAPPLPAPPLPAVVSLGPLDPQRMVFTDCDLQLVVPTPRRIRYVKARRPLALAAAAAAAQTPECDSADEVPP